MRGRPPSSAPSHGAVSRSTGIAGLVASGLHPALGWWAVAAGAGLVLASFACVLLIRRGGRADRKPWLSTHPA